MAIEKVKAYFEQYDMDKKIQILDVSSATVDLAATALHVEKARIAKTLSFSSGDNCILIVAAGDTKIDNAKFKKTFGMKAKMLSFDLVLSLVGHEVGGVCPFAINDFVPVYLDQSLKRFITVYPACGSSNSAIELSLGELEQYANTTNWVDVCKII